MFVSIVLVRRERYSILTFVCDRCTVKAAKELRLTTEDKLGHKRKAPHHDENSTIDALMSLEAEVR